MQSQSGTIFYMSATLELSMMISSSATRKPVIIVLLLKQEPLLYDIIVTSKNILVLLFYNYLNAVRYLLKGIIKIHDFPLVF